MVNPGAFLGARKAFLLGEKAAYVAGVQGGYSKDALALIQRRFFKRFPIEMSQDEEPTQAELAAVDDEEPEPEPEPLDEDSMPPDEYKEAQTRRQERKKLIEYRKAQIKRWLTYQYMKDHDLDPKDSGAHNPYHALLFQLTGKSINRPRRKPAINVWRRGHKEEIEDETRREVVKKSVAKGQVASLRERIARKLYDKVSPDQQISFEQQARDEYEEELARWKDDMSGPMSQTPESRQQCIQGLVHFIQPILDMVSDATGWKCTFIAGGPEPAHGGRLNVISVHAGTTTGDIKMNFGRAERVRYKGEILPIFGNFLKKCYSTDECRARALKPEEAYAAVDAAELESAGATLYTIEDTFGRDKSVSLATSSTHSLQLHPPDRSVTHAPPPTRTTPAVTTPCLPFHANPAPNPLPPIAPSPPLVAQAVSESNEVVTKDAAVQQGSTEASSQHPISPPRSCPPSPVNSPPCSCPPSPINSPPRPSPPSPINSPHLSPATAQDVASKVPNVAMLANSGDELPPRRSRKRTQDVQGVAQRSSKRAKRSVMPTDSRADRTAGAAVALVPADSSLDKRQRQQSARQRHVKADVAAVPSTMASLDIPSGAPDWLKKSADMFSQGDLGGRWLHLLNTWLTFEAKEEYAEAGALKSTHRPACVGEWIGRRRSPVWRPKLGALSLFQASYMKWWAALQPDWRLTKDGRVRHRSKGGGWETLRKSGINGLQSIVVALFFWGLEVQKNHSHTHDWAEAVEDLIVALSGLLTT